MVTNSLDVSIALVSAAVAMIRGRSLIAGLQEERDQARDDVHDLPTLSQLATPLGDLLPMRLSWLFIGYSTPYQVFSGVMETVAGLLLLPPEPFPRLNPGSSTELRIKLSYVRPEGTAPLQDPRGHAAPG